VLFLLFLGGHGTTLEREWSIWCERRCLMREEHFPSLFATPKKQDMVEQKRAIGIVRNVRKLV
jgi:hypothetical protein